MQSIKRILLIRQLSTINRFSTIKTIDESIIIPQLQRIYNNLYTLQIVNSYNNLNLKTIIQDTTKNVYILQKQLKINKVINIKNVDLSGHVDRY